MDLHYLVVLLAEAFVATLLEIIGNVYVAIVVGNVLHILANVSKTSEKHRERLDGVNSLMMQFPLPKPIRRQLRRWVVRAAIRTW
jgi:hypothetical protein